MMAPFRAVMTLLVLVAGGCRPDVAEWREKLASSNAPRLVGLWDVQLRLHGQGADTLRSSQATGQVVFTLDENRVSAPGLGAPPMVFGTYNIDFTQVGLPGATYVGFPGLVGWVRGDSVELVLAGDSRLPIQFLGVLVGDSVLGRWEAHSRAGRSGAGSFVLRRP